MSRAYVSLLASCIFLAGIAHAATAPDHARPAPPPVEDFFSAPDVSSLQISPDGKYVAFLAGLTTGRIGIAMMHLDTGKVEPLVGAKDENADFFFWKGSDRIVYGGDFRGNGATALRSIGIRQRKVISLSETFSVRADDIPNWSDVISTLRLSPEEILIVGNKEFGSWTMGYWRLNVRTGRRTLLEQLDGHKDSDVAVVASNGSILARVRDTGTRVIHEVRPDAKTIYKVAGEFDGASRNWDFLFFAGDDENLYLLTNDNSDRPVLHTLNVRTRELSEPLLETTDGEIVGLVTSEDRRALYGALIESAKLRFHWFDAGRAKVQAMIDTALPGTFNSVVSSTDDEQLQVVLAANDRDPGTYYLLDRRNNRLSPLFKVKERIKPAQMRPMDPIEFTARDGLRIHCYLTRPAGFENRPAPLIVLPHGGPFRVRDSWGFHPEVQFFASRGYAVLQVNFRGSGGYGSAFLQAGRHEWGGKMQDDITDGVRWAIAEGLADPDKVAIYGTSYGGYAALAGVVFTPELYRCAINYVGVSDLKILKRWGNFGRDSIRGYLKNWIGLDPDYLHQRSPVNFVDRIRVPTFHAYGFNDPRVDFDHWKRLKAQLVEHKKPFEEMVAMKEGHGFELEATRLEFYKRVEAFLAKHMPADN